MPREGVPYPGREICSIKCKLKEIWNALQGKLHSINGVQGDGQGNVKIVAGSGIVVNNDAAQNQIEIVNTGAAPEGMIETINGEGPDEDGNFSITAGSGIQINAGENGIEIENISEGAVYTGVSPITVNENNEISLEGWTTHPINTDLEDVVSNGITLKDVLITGVSSYGTGTNHYLTHCNIFIPKGTTLSTFYVGFNVSAQIGTSAYIAHFICYGTNILSTDAVVYGRQFSISGGTTGSGIYQTTQTTPAQQASATISKDYLKLYVR